MFWLSVQWNTLPFATKRSRKRSPCDAATTLYYNDDCDSIILRAKISMYKIEYAKIHFSGPPRPAAHAARPAARRGRSRGSQISHATNVKKQTKKKLDWNYVQARKPFSNFSYAVKIQSHSSNKTSISSCTLSQWLITQTISQMSSIQIRIDYSAF